MLTQDLVPRIAEGALRSRIELRDAAFVIERHNAVECRVQDCCLARLTVLQCGVTLRTFDGDDLRFEFHLAPPLMARRDPTTGVAKKMSFGPWMLRAFKVLASLRFLRGTAFDPFGRSVERRTERALIRDYEEMLDEILAGLTPENHHLAVGIASIPEKIRGFGHVKARHLTAAKAEEAALLDQFRAGPAPLLKAAE